MKGRVTVEGGGEDEKREGDEKRELDERVNRRMMQAKEGALLLRTLQAPLSWFV